MSPPPARYRALLLPASLITVLGALIIAAACAPIYTPNAAHTTLAPNQGTLQGGAYIGSGTFNGNVDATIIDRLSLLGSFSYEPWSFSGKALTSEDSTRANHMAHTFGEAGLGYTMMWRKTQLDLIAGFGMGRASALWPEDSTVPVSFYPIPDVTGDTLNGIYRVDGSYRRIFAQATLSRREFRGERRDEAMEGVLLRGSYVWFTELARDSRSTLHPRALFIDPIVFMRNGSRRIQFELQAGFSVKVPLADDQLRVQVIIINLGVHAVLDGLW